LCRARDAESLLGPDVVEAAEEIASGIEGSRVDDDPVGRIGEVRERVGAGKVGRGRGDEEVARIDRSVTVVQVELHAGVGEPSLDAHRAVTVQVVVDPAGERVHGGRHHALGEFGSIVGDETRGGGADGFARNHDLRQRDREAAVAGAVGGDVGKSEVALPLAMPAAIGNAVGEELDAVGRVRLAAHGADDGHLRSGESRAGQHREVLQVVPAGVEVAGVVHRDHAVVLEVDAQAGVGVDRVPQDAVADGAHPRNDHALLSVERDRVRVPEPRPADEVVARIGDVDPGRHVCKRGSATHIGPDAVALDDVRATTVQDDPLTAVAGDQVALAGKGAADLVVRGVDDDDAVRVRDRHGPRDVGADGVAPDDVSNRARAVDPHAAGAHVPGDQVSGAGRAEDVVCRVGDGDSDKLIPEPRSAESVGADPVAEDRVARAAGDLNAAAGIG
jgi:hypothetical protein